MMRLFRKPTSDEILVDQIKNHVFAIASLATEAKARGITVWLKDSSIGGSFFYAHRLKFDEAVRTTREKLG